jgi:superfamily II DNA or RNA helicase
MFLQQVGRALRPAPNKPHAFILDHAGNCARHGLPQDERAWTLDGRARREAAPEVIQCPSCFAMLPAATRTCPECEHTFNFGNLSTIDAQRLGRSVEQVAGTLIELTPEMIEQRRRQRQAEVTQAQSLDDLRAIERARGYRRGWAEHIIRARQGRRSA